MKLKEEIFVEHIKKHLKEGQKVVCKICNKDIDIIFYESKKNTKCDVQNCNGTIIEEPESGALVCTGCSFYVIRE